MRYLHEEDAVIVREGGSVRLYDDSGNRVYSFPGGTSDETVMLALRLANKAYDEGYDRGKDQKARELRAALGLEG